MLGALSIPPRLVLRALDDLHSVAGNLSALVESVRVLPRTEDDLSANIAALRDDIQALNGLLAPLIASLEPIPVELRDLDQTAEALDASMERLQAMLKKLPGV
jgi:ABC-type transporter Mla subunit MlaD